MMTSTVTVLGLRTDPLDVNIGLHYVALTNGVLMDTYGDGITDYIEDVNGNGAVDSGESDWQSYNSPNKLTGAPGLQVYTPLK